MKIHAIQTGTVALTTKWREGQGRGQMRLVHTLFDREWTEALPIYAFAIEHPDGVIVVDTGETARIAEPGYFPRWQPFFRFAVRMQVAPEQEIGPQLAQLGIETDVRTVVLTHLHTDHAGGLPAFEGRDIVVTREELDYASGLAGRTLHGYPNKRWPEWFAPRTVELEPEPYGPFPQSLRIAEGVVAVPTPGHSPGHISVVVEEDDDGAVFIAGDSSYTEAAMLEGTVDGVGPDPRAQRLTHEWIRELAGSRPLVYLPAHDPETGERLATRTRTRA
jgi:N-acyl homoserine lactone hydrolase